MRVLRTILSALCLITAAAALVVWPTALAAQRTLADPEVYQEIAEQVAGRPDLTRVATRQAQDFLHGQLLELGIDLSVVGLDGALDSLVAEVIDSAGFRTAVDRAVADAGEQLAGSVTATDGPGRAYVVTLDAAGIVHDRLTEEPLLDLLLPDFPTIPVSIEAVSAADMAELQATYRDAGRAVDMAPTIAAAAIAVGFLVSPRKRWFPAKLLVTAGAAALAASAYVGARGVGLIETRLAESGAGEAGPLFAAYAQRETIPELTRLLDRGGGLAVMVGFVAGVVAWLATRRTGLRLRSEPDKRSLEVPA